MRIYKEDMNTSKGLVGVTGWGPNYQFINYFPHLLPEGGLPNLHTTLVCEAGAVNPLFRQ